MPKCFAAIPPFFGDQRVDTFIETSPLFELSQWWHLFILVAAIVVCILFTIAIAIRDWSDQKLGVIAAGFFLRISILAVILFFFLNFEKRRAQVSVNDSRLSVILDNSLSMNLPSDDSTDSATRFETAVADILDSELWSDLTLTHEIRFFQLTDPGVESTIEEVATLPRRPNNANEDGSNVLDLGESSNASVLDLMGYQIGWLAGAFGVVCFVGGVFVQRGTLVGSWLTFFSAVVIVVASCILLISDVTNERRLAWRTWESTWNEETLEASVGNEGRGVDEEFRAGFARLKTDLNELLPNVEATKLSDAIVRTLLEQNGQALSSVILLTDGGSNAGSNIAVASNLAKANGVSVYPIGIGTNRMLENISVIDLRAPSRVYLGDPFSVSGNIRLESVTSVSQLELILSSSQASRPELVTEVARNRMDIDPKQPLQFFSFPFENQPQGEWTFSVSVVPLDSEVSVADNLASTDVEVIDKVSSVLLFAGGPNREFRFLRNQLFRDPKIKVDVLLQTADDGADQEGDNLLTRFPKMESELFGYDCIIAFDPDWSQLSSEQTELVRRWVADEAGGLVVVAGPVNTPIWTSRPNDDNVIDPIRKLYPVQFYSQSTGSIKLGRFGGTESFPLEFTNIASSLEFLRFAEANEQNDEIWKKVKVFGFYAVNDEKPGAEVIAHFSDPATRYSGKSPIYLASQLYGSGRIFFQASGEMWRTRGVGPEFFESYYTRLIRWSSQGRLLRDSGSVVLSVDKENCRPGELVEIRAILKKADGEISEMETLPVTINRDGSSELIELTRLEDGTKNTIFAGSFTVRSVGKHRVEFTMLKSENERGENKNSVAIDFVSRIPNLELIDPRRNDRLLSTLAESSGGEYFLASEWSSHRDRFAAALRSVPDNRIETVSSLGFDELFRKRLMVGYFLLLTLFYSLSWVIRRSHRLA